jgi:hypothetical protein
MIPLQLDQARYIGTSADGRYNEVFLLLFETKTTKLEKENILHIT